MGDPRGPSVAVVPFRSPGEGLSRLEGRLLRSERAALASAMLADVVVALRAAPVDRVVVVASGPDAVSTARAMGLDVVIDPPSATSLDEALRAAMPRTMAGHGSVLVAMADLPLLTTDDVVAALDADAQVVVAPTSDGGTGLLVRRPVTCIETSYGPGSAARHMRAGRNAGIATTSVDLPGVALDVDVLDDLYVLLDAEPGGATGQVFGRFADRIERARAVEGSTAGLGSTGP